MNYQDKTREELIHELQELKAAYFHNPGENKKDGRVIANSAGHRHSERQLATLMSNLPGMVYTCLNNKDWTMKFVSEGSIELTGYLPEELTGGFVTYNNIIHPEDLEMVWETIQKALKVKIAYTLEYRIITKSGILKHVWERGQGIFDDNMQLRHLEGFITNITERKLGEIENKRTQRLLEDSQRIGKIGGWEFNIDTLELKWTREMYNIHEVDPTFKPMVDQRASFYTPESLPVIDDAVKNAVEYGESYEVDSEIITQKGNRKSVKAIGQADLENRRIFGLFQDITERKQAEEAIKESEEKYRNLFENSQVGKFRTLIDGSRVLEVNQKLCEILGFSKNEMINKPSTIRYADPTRRDDLASLLSQCKFVNDFEAEFITKDGSVKTLLMSLTAYPEKGILEGSFVDITDRKKAEAELKIKNEQLKELNATKDMFFSIIAHDLKSPFGGILGFSGILKDEARDLDINEIVKYADFINSLAQQTYNLLENLLDWAKTQQGGFHFEPRKILINNLIQSEIKGLKYHADQKNIRSVYRSKEEIVITADEKMLSSVIRNLISNAIKFTPKGGSIVAEAKIERDHFEISITDTGKGMEKETIEKLFKIETSFTTRGTENEKGSGLGLLLCKEFVKIHGGTIWAESEPGKGSRFTISIPCMD